MTAMPRFILIALMILLLAPLAACGKKAAPSPPGEESSSVPKFPHVYPREDPDAATIPSPAPAPPKQ